MNLIDRLEKITGANNYPEKPKRLQNIGIGVVIAAILLLGLHFTKLNPDTSVSITLGVVFVGSLVVEELDYRKGGYRNWCHFMMRVVGAGVSILIYQGII
jgi:hypothetical protein